MRIRAIIIVCMGLTGWLPAQSVNGFVRDDATGEPLFYVNVFLQDTDLGAATNQDGYFVIPKIPPGTYEIVVSIIGYQMKRQSLTIEAGENVRLDFRLTAQAIEGETINVTAAREKYRQTVEPSQVILDIREIQVAPAFIEADVFRTIQMLPGVQTLNDFSSALYVRGSTPDQNLIMLDGITVYNPYHIGGVFSTFNTDAIKEADFHAGGFPARYGGRMGAILNIINREGNTEEVTGSANVSIISSKGMIEGPLPDWKFVKGSWMLAGRRTYFDKVADLFWWVAKPIIVKNDPYLAEDELPDHLFPYYFYDLEGKVNLDFSDNHRITLSSFYGDDVFYLENRWSDNYSEPTENYKEIFNEYGLFDWRWGNRTNSLTWRWIASPNLILKTFLADSRFRFRIDFDEKSWGTYTFDGEETEFRDDYYMDIFDIVHDQTAEAEIVWHPNERHTITGGMQQKYVNFRLGMKFSTVTLDTSFSYVPLDMRDNTVESAVYVQDRWTFGPRFSTQIGFRTTRYSLHKTWYPDPRVGMKYMLTDVLSLKFNWGRYHQFLTVANPQDENFRFIDIWLGIPEDRPAGRAEHTILGVEYLDRRNILYRAEAYYKDFQNLITLRQTSVFTDEEGTMTFEPFNEFWDTQAYAWGLEFLVKKTTGKVQGWIGYTYAHTERKTDLHGWYVPKYDRTHTLNAVADWQWTDITHVSMAISSSSGNPYTPILGRYQKFIDYGYEYVGFWRDERLLVGEKNSARYPMYFRWDISFIRRKPTKHGFREWYIQIINVTNHMNPLIYIYDYGDGYRRDEDQSMRRLPIPMFPFIPTVGVRYEF